MGKTSGKNTKARVNEPDATPLDTEAEQVMSYSEFADGGPEEHEGELKGIAGEMDAGDLATLLHIVVGEGSSAGVRELLAKGADPLARDHNRLTALQLAEGLCTEQPESEDRKACLQLLKSASEDVAGLCLPSGSESTEGGDDPTSGELDSVLGRLEGMVSQLGRDFNSMKSSLGSEVKSQVDSLSIDLKYAVKSIRDTNANLIHGNESVDGLKDVTKSLVLKVDELQEINRKLSAGMSTLKDILGVAPPALLSKRPIEGGAKEGDGNPSRDPLLMENILGRRKGDQNSEAVAVIGKADYCEFSEAIGSFNAPTSIGDAFKDLEVANDAIAREISDSELLNRSRENPEQFFNMNFLGVVSSHEENLQRQSIDAMMRMTEILQKDERKALHVKGLYEKLYSKSPLISILLNYLQFEESLKIHIDCEYRDIRRMKKTFVDLDGDVKRCENRRDVVDFEEGAVYLAAGASSAVPEDRIIAFLANSLCVVAVHRVFGNGGRPYGRGDEEARNEYMEIVEPAEAKRQTGFYFGNTISWALDRATRLERELFLIATVPKIIASYGSSEGIAFLRRELPSLLEFYETNVVATLKREFESKMPDPE